MVTISKEFKWEAAHRLIQGYPGKCKNIHGHSYVAKVTLKSTILDRYGFVKDFGDFKPFKDWIDNNLDHATIVSEDDKELQLALNELNSKYFILHYPNTSAEYLSMELFSRAKILLFGDIIKLVSVTVYETCTSEAVYTP